MNLFYITDAQYIAICCALIISLIINIIIILFHYLAQKFPGLFFEEEEPEQDNRPKSKYFINL